MTGLSAEEFPSEVVELRNRIEAEWDEVYALGIYMTGVGLTADSSGSPAVGISVAGKVRRASRKLRRRYGEGIVVRQGGPWRAFHG